MAWPVSKILILIWAVWTVCGLWHTGKIFDTMGKRKHVSCADDPGFFIFIERRKGGKVVANDLKEGGEMNQ